MPLMRHVVDVMRPTESQDGFGARSGEPETLYSQCPCKVETLSGNELLQARTVFSTVTHKVTKLFLDPNKRLKSKDYLLLNGRRLNIGFPNDIGQNGVEWELLCTEQV